jgi:hypothetical protein
MATDKKSLKEMFPNLYKELEEGEVKIPINAVRKDPFEVEGTEFETESIPENDGQAEPSCTPDKLRHFNPSAVDFIRRCDTETQAEEIISYMQKKGEITKEYAEELRCKLKSKGVRGFGPKKEEYFYFKEGGLY